MWPVALARKSRLVLVGTLVLLAAAAVGWSLFAQGAARGAPAATIALPASAGAANTARPRAPVEFTEALSHRVGHALRLPGTARSPRRADVASSTAGLVKAVHFREGQAITRGDLLATLHVRSLEIRKETLGARLQEAMVRSESARNRFERASTLSKAQLISTEQLDDARFEQRSQSALAESLRSEIAELEHSISLGEIRAPFGGIVSRKLTEVGQWLKIGDPLVTMLALEPMEVLVELPESYLGAVRPGQHTKVEFDALKSATFAGVVSAILPEASGDARTFPVLVSVENPRAQVRGGMLAMVEFQSVGARGGVVVPRDALVRKDTGHVVYVIGPEDVVEEKSVSPGAASGSWVDVSGTLREGERVVTRGNERLSNGQAVTARRLEYARP
jgi:RND family efflux transporter MFP subunit